MIDLFCLNQTSYVMSSTCSIHCISVTQSWFGYSTCTCLCAHKLNPSPFSRLFSILNQLSQLHSCSLMKHHNGLILTLVDHLPLTAVWVPRIVPLMVNYSGCVRQCVRLWLMSGKNCVWVCVNNKLCKDIKNYLQLCVNVFITGTIIYKVYSGLLPTGTFASSGL